MAESDFNLGPNFPPGGAPENPRVNNAAYDADLKKAQQTQVETIKSLTETIKGLTEQYAELTNTDKKLSEEELAASKMLREKIDVLSEMLASVKSDAAKGGPQVPLTAVGIKERTETFTKLSKVITDFQRSSADLKMAGGGELQFDQWFANYLEQQKVDTLSLSEQEHNNLLLQDVKKILKDSNTSLSSLSEDELEELAKRSIKLSIEQKQRETELLQQNKDVIKLNKDANAQDIKNVKSIVESNKFDPSKPIIEYGFKAVNKQMHDIVENTKPRSLFKIVTDLMGPLGKIVYFFTKFVVGPLLLSFGILAGFFIAQHIKLKRIGEILSGDIFVAMFNALRKIKDIVVFVYKDVPLIVSSFINTLGKEAAHATQPIRVLSRIFAGIANKSESLFFFWTRLTEFIAKIPAGLKQLGYFLKTYEESVGKLRSFGKLYLFAEQFISYVGSIGKGIGEVFGYVGKLGSSVLRLSGFVAETASGILSPIVNFFSSGIGKFALIIDKMGGGLMSFFRTGVYIGKWIGGIVAPLAAVITVISDLPKFFKGLFSGNVYTMVKSIMGLIVQIAGFVLAYLFGGPIGGIAAGFALKFENIMKWFDPIFDFLIYAGGLVFGLIWSVYTDFVQPAFEAIGQVVMTVLNLAFFLLKPVFKFAQFVLILLSPLFALVALIFKGLGYVFKGIGWLFKAINDNIVEPFIKFSEWFAFKFIQPIYDWLASTILGKILGMETKEKRLARERKEKAEKMKAEEPTEESGTAGESALPEFKIGIDKSTIDAGMVKTKEFVGTAVETSTNMVKDTANSLKTVSEDFSGSVYHLADTMKTYLTPITITMVELAKQFGARGMEMGRTGLNKIAPIGENVLTNSITPVSGYSTMSSITPVNAPERNRMAEEYQMMNAILQQASADSKERAANSTVNNQQTTVVNNTNGGPMLSMPSNSERTVNQINYSVRPAG